MRDERILDDLSEEELADYENNPDKYEDVIDNTNEHYTDLMYPEGIED